MGQVFLAKSAATDLEDQDRIVGTLDVPVNVRGQAEIADMARELEGVGIDAIYACASESARQTAGQLAKKLGCKVKELDDLRNLDFGLWQGLPSPRSNESTASSTPSGKKRRARPAHRRVRRSSKSSIALKSVSARSSEKTPSRRSSSSPPTLFEK